MIKYDWKKDSQFTQWKPHEDFLKRFTHTFDTIQQQQVIQAINLVKRLHNEPRIDGVGNANRHPMRVARILIEEMEMYAIDTILIALLHDVLEDTSYKETLIEHNYGDRVLLGVKMLTRPREKEWGEYVHEIVKSNNMAVLKIKVADKLDNARSHARSTNEEMREKDMHKILTVMKPVVEKYFPERWILFDDVLQKWI